MKPTVIPENDSVDSSITTGSLPFEFLPVDSAISCSIQLESPGVVEFLSQKFITWSDKENRLAAILIAGESIKERGNPVNFHPYHFSKRFLASSTSKYSEVGGTLGGFEGRTG